MPAGPPQKPWTELGKKTEVRDYKEIADRILPNIAAPDDYYDFLLNLNAHIGKEHPSIQEQDTKCWQLIKYLSELRGAEQDSNDPPSAFRSWDSAVTRLGFSNKELAEKGYKLSKSQIFLKGVRSGRQWYKKRSASKLHNSEFHQHCLRWNLSVCHWFWASGCLGPRFQETDGACEASDKDQASHLPRRQRLANGNVLGDLSPQGIHG